MLAYISVPDASSASASKQALAPLELPAAASEGQLCGWGRVPGPGREVVSSRLEVATRGARLCRGLGRSYGDSSLPAEPGDRVVQTRLGDRILHFDAQAGVVRAEAGLSLERLNRLSFPRGWFTPVTPGTQFVTLGGMVASDVHGKNHHVAGCFGAHVLRLRLRLASDEVVECSPLEHADLFYGCIGGMGLLGHILEVEFSLEPIASPWIQMESERVGSIEQYLEALAEAAGRFPMTMGWIDCLSGGKALGRGILMAGRWAPRQAAPRQLPPAPRALRFPFELPNWALNRFTAKAFNAAYYGKHGRGRRTTLCSPAPFFYPLDAIRGWNLAYGPRGFTQYQCVLPRAAGPAAVRQLLAELARSGAASPLCVIKDCGPESRGCLSFPLEGTSVAVDMAIGADTQRVVDRLNEFVIEAGGRIYLTKDRFTRAEHFARMEPRLPAFQQLRDRWDPHGRLRSAQSLRIMGR